MNGCKALMAYCLWLMAPKKQAKCTKNVRQVYKKCQVTAENINQPCLKWLGMDFA